MERSLLLNDVRCAFLVLGAPEDYQGNKKFRWGAVALIPYDSGQHKRVLAKLREVANDAWGPKAATYFEAVMSDRKSTCYVDGKYKPDYDGYAGHYALSAYRYATQERPLVFDKDKSPIYKPDGTLYEGKAGRLYSGMYVNMHVELWAQDNGNGRGLRCTLLGIQAARTGDAFGGGSRPVPEAFTEITDGADDESLT
jgi:hypothetical protein